MYPLKNEKLEPQNSGFNSSALLASPEGTMLCGHYSWGDANMCLLIPGRELTRPKSTLVNQRVLLGLFTWVRGHLQDQKQLYGSCITKSQHW